MVEEQWWESNGGEAMKRSDRRELIMSELTEWQAVVGEQWRGSSGGRAVVGELR